jgi:eukaryotic-like serine/threonine-protein kinase
MLRCGVLVLPAYWTESDSRSRYDSVILPPGTRVGHYEIIRWLGKGGMGDVYVARDVRLDREIALKFISTGYAEVTLGNGGVCGIRKRLRA